MLNDFSGSKVYLACGYTDFRRGIDGLATIVEQQFKLDPCSDALFLFCGRRTDRIKALYWEATAFSCSTNGLKRASFNGRGARMRRSALLLNSTGGSWKD